MVVLVALVSASAGEDRPQYERSLYRHWIKVEGTCRDVRAVVLIRDAEPGTVFFADPRECKVGSGFWRDPYTGQTFSDPREIDISASVRNMLDAFRIQASAGPVTDKASAWRVAEPRALSA